MMPPIGSKERKCLFVRSVRGRIVGKRPDVINVDGSTLNAKVLQQRGIRYIALRAALFLEATR